MFDNCRARQVDQYYKRTYISDRDGANKNWYATAQALRDKFSPLRFLSQVQTAVCLVLHSVVSQEGTDLLTIIPSFSSVFCLFSMASKTSLTGLPFVSGQEYHVTKANNAVGIAKNNIELPPICKFQFTIHTFFTGCLIIQKPNLYLKLN